MHRGFWRAAGARRIYLTLKGGSSPTPLAGSESHGSSRIPERTGQGGHMGRSHWGEAMWVLLVAVCPLLPHQPTSMYLLFWVSFFVFYSQLLRGC